eukprot:1162134-Pelagomonas_calceolata.AAC.9
MHPHVPWTRCCSAQETGCYECNQHHRLSMAFMQAMLVSKGGCHHTLQAFTRAQDDTTPSTPGLHVVLGSQK